MNICIGIISWFPDNEHRNERVRRCKNLLAQCSELFGIPIVVIAQNWRDEIDSENIIKINYPRLGITKARKVLWGYFKKSDYDWMICFDDDCILEGSREDGQAFLDFLRTKDNGYLCGKRYEFKLSAFHRSAAKNIDLLDLDVEARTGIEDYGFFRFLELKYPHLAIPYQWKGLKETSIWEEDQTTAWDRHDITELVVKTNEHLKNY